MKDNVLTTVATIAFVVLAWLAGNMTGRAKCNAECGAEIPKDTTSHKVEYKRDTVYLDKPVPVVSHALKDSIHALIALNDLKSAMIDSLLGEIYGNAPMDTIDVTLPREQKEYGDSTYHAWVSGYQPALDSINIYNRIEWHTVTIRESQRPSHWGLGVQVGLGVGAHDNKVFTTPYIGFGLTYTFLRF